MNLRKAFLVLTTTAALGVAAPAFASLNGDVCSAAAGGDYNGVMTALQLGANPNVRDRVGRTPLGWAAKGGYGRVVVYLLAHGAAIDAIDNEGNTPLMLAARAGAFETVAILIDHGANPLVRDRHGEDAVAIGRRSRDWRIEDMITRYLHGETVGRAPRPRRPNPVLGAMPAQAPASNPRPLMAAPTPRPTARPAEQSVRPPTPVAAEPRAAVAAEPRAAVAAEPRAAVAAEPRAAVAAEPHAVAAAEPNAIAKVLALKKLAEAGVQASSELDKFVKANATNPMALMDPDVMLGKELVTLYANVAKGQSLVQCRADFKKVQDMWAGRTGSRFTKNIQDVDTILKEAGL